MSIVYGAIAALFFAICKAFVEYCDTLRDSGSESGKESGR